MCKKAAMCKSPYRPENDANQAMVCTTNDLLGWSDFPRGLRVLLLDEDSNSLDEIKSKLEKMDYIVSSFCNEKEALSAISNRSDCFHVAIVEVNTENSHGRFKFLEATKDLPTIMTSNMICLSTMMKCIALGAVEFLSKPLSDDKLKNLWQHVVHKAFNAEEKDVPQSLKPVKESVFSMLSSQNNNEEKKSNLSVITEENIHETSTMSDKCPASPTPQLKQGVRLVDDGDCQDQPNCLTDRENGNQDGESKFVEITICNNGDEVTTKASETQSLGESIVKIEDQGPTASKSKNNLSSQPNNKIGHGRCVLPSSRGKKTNRKKTKMHADTWGSPVMPLPHGFCQPPPQNADGFYNANIVHGSYGVPQDSFDLYPGEEEIDRVMKEVISKPWLPLPIGLNPPSTDSVLVELSKVLPNVTNDICHL